MPLTLVLGPANSAKAGEVLGAYADAAQRGAVLVVPTASDADHYARELAAEGAVLGSVRTFAGLAREIAGRAGFSARCLSALQRERVLRRVLRRMRFEVLGRSAQAPGFVAAAAQLIAELQRSLVSPERFAQALDAWAAHDDRRAPYGGDLGSLYLGYRRDLERLGMVDAELYAWRALDALRTAPARWGTDPVFFYGFDDLTPLERDAIETLARVAGTRVTVSLTYEHDHPALLARAETVQSLMALADRLLELPALDQHYESGARAPLHHLERRLLRPNGERIDPGPAVRLLEAGGERAEAELVASEVLALIAEGVAADEIVVVYRSPGRVASLLSHVFGTYGLELAGAHRVPFAHTALGRGLRALARCALQEGGSAQDLVDYLRAPGVLARIEVADALEATVRRDGLRTAAQARACLGVTLDELDTLRAAADPARELRSQALRLFAAPHRRSASILDRGGRLDARAVATLHEALAELEQIGERLSAEELLELLDALDVEVEADLARSAHPGAVLLADPLSIRARRFSAVFVCGLQENEFPLPGVSEPFLSDERRRELSLAAGLVLRPAEDALARERCLFYACVSRATGQLVLSYRSSDEEGNLMLPSPFIADVAELMVDGWSERRRRRLLADVVWAPDGAPTEREHLRALAARAGASPADATESRPQRRSLGEAALRRVRHRKILSAGALESYAACPLTWFVERELAPERFEPELDAIARGSYMHAALEELVRRLGGPVTPATLERAGEILGEVLPELGEPIAPGRSDAVRAGALQAIEADLRRYLAHEAADGCGWDPQGIELQFGFDDREGSLPALVLGEGARQIQLRGLIDRVDVDPSGGARAIVRDYKSGSARPEHQGARWRVDGRLQVALYMLAVRRLLGLQPVGGLYQPLGGGDLRARGIYLQDAPVGARLFATDSRSPEEIEVELDDAAQRALKLAVALRAGELEPCPARCSRDGCRYPGICWSQR